MFSACFFSICTNQSILFNSKSSLNKNRNTLNKIILAAVLPLASPFYLLLLVEKRFIEWESCDYTSSKRMGQWALAFGGWLTDFFSEPMKRFHCGLWLTGELNTSAWVACAWIECKHAHELLFLDWVSEQSTQFEICSPNFCSSVCNFFVFCMF